MKAAIPLLGRQENREDVVIAAACSSRDLQNLIQTIARALESVSLSITSQNVLPTTEGPQSPGGSKTILITASCYPKRLGKLMQIVTDTRAP